MAEGLHDLGPELVASSLHCVEQLLGHPVESVRIEAIEALARHDSTSSRLALASALHDRSRVVRLRAALVLLESTGGATVQRMAAVLRATETDRGRPERHAAQEASGPCCGRSG